MTETIRYGLIGKEDLKLGTATFEVELSDGRIVTLTELNLSEMVLKGYLEANVPTTTGVLSRATDGTRGVRLGTGTQAFAISGEVVNVEEFGAVGDTTTDNTTTIQAAIDATPTNGVLYFPTTGFVAGPLTLKPSITILGPQGMEFNESGVSVLEFRDATGNFLSLTGATTQLGVNIVNMVIDGNDTTGRVLNFQTSRSAIVRSTIKNGGAGSYGVFLAHGGAATAVENRIHESIIQGFAIGVHAEGNATDGFITDSLIYGNTSKDVELVQASGWLIADTHTYGTSATRTISIDAQTSQVRIRDNFIEGSTATGFIGIKQIYTQAFNSGAIRGNIIALSANDSIGIDLTATVATRGKVDGNTVFESAGVTGSIGIQVGGSFTIFGDLGLNNLDNVDTRISTDFGADTNFLDLTSDRLALGGREIRLLADATATERKYRVASATPEGAVTANVGSIFSRTDGGESSSFYVKESGTSNTGWRPVPTILTAFGALNFDLAANVTEDLTIAVTGAETGDAVIVSPQTTFEAGLVFMGFVSAADVVTVRVGNVTTGAIDPANRNFRVTVIKH